jgi:hypothetical protein
VEAIMVLIFDGVRLDAVTGTTLLYRGTKEFLAASRAEILHLSARLVPAHQVDPAGKYLVEKDELPSEARNPS